ncbi:MAG TPA: energy transducer TonB [Kofleriaceae bacterium]|nr:energy transducer TonB [Kofleriaceae bacterium]
MAASVLVHVIVLLVVHYDDEGMLPSSTVPATATATAAAKEKAKANEPPNCPTKVALAAVARAGFCSTPLADDPDRCLEQLAHDWDAWMGECTARLAIEEEEDRQQSVQIALLDDTLLEDLQPMPILPLLEPEKQAQFEKQEEQKLEEKIEEQQKQQETRAANAQVVEVAKPDVEMAPDKARFVSEHDVSVKKETVARGSKHEAMVARPAPEELPVADVQKLPEKQLPPELSPNKPPEIENEKGTGALSMRDPGQLPRELPPEVKRPGARGGVEDPLEANGLAPRKGDGLKRTPRRELTAQPPGQGGETGEMGGPKRPDLRPTPEMLSRMVGGGSVDHVEGIANDESTALNSRRWKYATFFNRMKREVARSWNPNRVYLQRDPNGNVYGSKDRITVVKVSLKPDGGLAKIYVQSASGAPFLDDEALRAFKAAQPFPNPPGALVDPKTGLIEFSFGFHFQIGSDRSRWKVFRYQ